MLAFQQDHDDAGERMRVVAKRLRQRERTRSARDLVGHDDLRAGRGAPHGCRARRSSRPGTATATRRAVRCSERRAPSARGTRDRVRRAGRPRRASYYAPLPRLGETRCGGLPSGGPAPRLGRARTHACRRSRGERVESNAKAAVAEGVGTFALIFFGAGSVILYLNGQLDLVGVALAHGLVIAVMVSQMAHLSGGAFNPAIQIALWVTGKSAIHPDRRVPGGELVGAAVAALLLKFLVPAQAFDAALGGTPTLGDGISSGKGILLEAVGTFFLVWAVFATIVIFTPYSRVGGPPSAGRRAGPRADPPARGRRRRTPARARRPGHGPAEPRPGPGWGDRGPGAAEPLGRGRPGGLRRGPRRPARRPDLADQPPPALRDDLGAGAGRPARPTPRRRSLRPPALLAGLPPSDDLRLPRHRPRRPPPQRPGVGRGRRRADGVGRGPDGPAHRRRGDAATASGGLDAQPGPPDHRLLPHQASGDRLAPGCRALPRVAGRR